MGISLDDAKMLARISRRGISFEKVLTLGRQQLYFRPEDFRRELVELGYSEDQTDIFLSEARNEGPADPLFRLIGAREIIAMDMSGYQGADLRHDLNVPVDPSLHERFDVVYDGGTLEHVFNFPVGVRSAMEMVKVGGSFVSVSPANNQMGHGFYQFSPELFYNIFSDENGFEISTLQAIEISPKSRRYLVSNPSIVRSRVTLVNLWPVNLFVHAVRRRRATLFARAPQQSDYSALWAKGGETGIPTNADPEESSARAVARTIARRWFRGPVSFFSLLRHLLFSSAFGFRNRKFFKRVAV